MFCINCVCKGGEPTFDFYKRRAHIDLSAELSTNIRELNIDRVGFASFFYFIFQIINLMDTRFEESSLYILGLVSVSAVGIAFFIVSIVLKVKGGNPTADYSRFAFVFWFLMLFAMIPYYAKDIVLKMDPNLARPVNMMLYALTCAVMPVFKLRHLIWTFFLCFAVNTVVAVIWNASQAYLLFIAAISLGGFVLACIFQQQYLYTIYKLQMEKKTDGLTGIFNRSAGLEKAEASLEYCKRCWNSIAFYMIDIDYFKMFNDKYGHSKGDLALKMVARALENTFNRSTDTVCRYGGEEFMICIANCAQPEAEAMANRLLAALKALQKKAPYNSVPERLTVSIGYYIYIPKDHNLNVSVSSIVDKADAAMYEAKKRGRNRIVKAEA